MKEQSKFELITFWTDDDDLLEDGVDDYIPPPTESGAVEDQVMRKKRAYYGCEMESPLYRQVAAEMAAKREGKTVINEHKTKRGKRS